MKIEKLSTTALVSVAIFGLEKSDRDAARITIISRCDPTPENLFDVIQTKTDVEDRDHIQDFEQRLISHKDASLIHLGWLKRNASNTKTRLASEKKELQHPKFSLDKLVKYNTPTRHRYEFDTAVQSSILNHPQSKPRHYIAVFRHTLSDKIKSDVLEKLLDHPNTTSEDLLELTMCRSENGVNSTAFIIKHFFENEHFSDPENSTNSETFLSLSFGNFGKLENESAVSVVAERALDKYLKSSHRTVRMIQTIAKLSKSGIVRNRAKEFLETDPETLAVLQMTSLSAEITD